jgi:ABC-2 type transport system ATP-binding protein
LNMLATLVTPTRGEAWIFGQPLADRAAVRRLLGVALQVTGVDPMMSVYHHFEVQAALYEMGVREARSRAAALIDAFELGAVSNRRVSELSGGTQRRLSLALALLHGPRAIIFDEPTVGLDPSAKRTVWALLENLRQQGLAILFSTHDMDEADQVCRRIDVIADGRIVASGPPAELKARVTPGVLRIRIRKGVEFAAQALDVAMKRGLLTGEYRFRVEDDVLQVRAELLDESFLPLLTLVLEEVGVDIIELSWGHGTLDDVFASVGNGATAKDLVSRVAMEHHVHARRSRR